MIPVESNQVSCFWVMLSHLGVLEILEFLRGRKKRDNLVSLKKNQLNLFWKVAVLCSCPHSPPPAYKQTFSELSQVLIPTSRKTPNANTWQSLPRARPLPLCHPCLLLPVLSWDLSNLLLLACNSTVILMLWPSLSLPLLFMCLVFEWCHWAKFNSVWLFFNMGPWRVEGNSCGMKEGGQERSLNIGMNWTSMSVKERRNLLNRHVSYTSFKRLILGGSIVIIKKLCLFLQLAN